MITKVYSQLDLTEYSDEEARQLFESLSSGKAKVTTAMPYTNSNTLKLVISLE